MKWFTVIVTAILTLATPAGAVTHDDPDDVRGRLDLRQVTRTFSNPPSAPALVHLQSTTYDGWTLRECWRAEGCTPYWFFDSRRGGGVDFAAFWNVERRRPGRFEPSCAVFNYRTGRRLAVGDASKFRRSAFCEFRKAVLKADKRIRWRALSSWEEFTDTAPNRGWYGPDGSS